VIPGRSRELLRAPTKHIRHDSGGVEQVEREHVRRISHDLICQRCEARSALACRPRVRDERALPLDQGETVTEKALEEGIRLNRLGVGFVGVFANEKAVEMPKHQQPNEHHGHERQPPQQRPHPQLGIVASRGRLRHRPRRAGPLTRAKSWCTAHVEGRWRS
jgi:hypothetical protein